MISTQEIELFWSRVLRAGDDDCWPWSGTILPNGYGRFNSRGQSRSTHRLAWSLANGKEPSLSILHSCDNRKCCNPAHLREGTTADNMRDKVERGRSCTGERNGRARLTAWQIAVVRLLYSQGVIQKHLAKDFGVAQTTISAIVRGATWGKEVANGA